MSNIVIFGAPHSGKTTLLGYLSTGMFRHPQFNLEILQKLKLIKKLEMEDDFCIGDPYNPIHIRKDIILPSFVSLDRDELRKFTDEGENSPGTSKRLHHKQLTLCMSGREETWTGLNENENTTCTFIDLPGFRQRISDKYKGFFEGDVGLALLDIKEVLKLEEALKRRSQKKEAQGFIDKQERKLFEPVRIWCDYRSSAQLIIVLSKIDQELIYNDNKVDVAHQSDAVRSAVECIRSYTKTFGGKNAIPVVPISIRITQEENTKKKPRMKVFFRREAENIYEAPPGKNLPGDGTLVTCLKRLLKPHVSGQDRAFSMASVDRPMRAMVNYKRKTALQICANHGTLHDTDKVVLGPVLYRRSNEICYTRCTIASLKADGAKEPSSMLFEGNVGGVIFKSITNIEERPSERYALNSVLTESDIRILRSTILFTGEAIQGDVVVLEIYKKEYLTINGEIDILYTDILRSLMPYDEITLFWYGKKILVKVIEIHFLEDRLCLSVMASNSQCHLVPHFTLPCNEDGTIRHCDNVLLAIPDTGYFGKTGSGESIYTYISANAKEIRNSEEYDSIRTESGLELGLGNILKENLRFESEKIPGGERLIIPIKSTRKKDNLNIILTSIRKNLRYNFSRRLYQSKGGIEIYLAKSMGKS